MPKSGSRRSVERESSRAKAWQSMRIMKRFSWPDLVKTADIGKSAAQKYLAALNAAGFVRVVRKGVPVCRTHAIYQLLKDTGPHAPKLRTDGSLFDPNTGEEYTELRSKGHD